MTKETCCEVFGVWLEVVLTLYLGFALGGDGFVCCVCVLAGTQVFKNKQHPVIMTPL
jgi:hypothetical protein